MNLKKKKKIRSFLFLIISIILVGLIVKFKDYELIKNKVNTAQAAIEKKEHAISKKMLTGKTIVVDAGHGGEDIGASGQSGTLEKKLTLTMAKNIQMELEKRTGATVILTRKDDVKISLEDRVKIAEESNTDLFVSIHFDAFFTSEVEGITSYYHKKSDEPLATMIHNHIFNRGLDARDRGVSLGDYYVLRENTRPSILLELGYISNSTDEARMTSEEFQTNTSNAIVDGIISYLK